MLEQPFVHPPAVRDVGVNDAIVLHREVVVVVVVAVQDEHDRAADVGDREHREVEEIAGHDHARAGRHGGGQPAHDGVQVLDRQRVLDRRLAVAGQRLREPDVGR